MGTPDNLVLSLSQRRRLLPAFLLLRQLNQRQEVQLTDSELWQLVPLLVWRRKHRNGGW